MTRDELEAMITRVNAGLRITKVVCTRSIKGKTGDTFVGFSAAWNSVQEEGGQGMSLTGEETDVSQSLNAMTMEEALVASCIVAREVDTAAHQHAAASGGISDEYCHNAIKAIDANYTTLILDILNGNRRK